MRPRSLLLRYDAFALTGGQRQSADIWEKMPLCQKRPQLSGGHQGVAQQKGPPANIFWLYFYTKTVFIVVFKFIWKKPIFIFPPEQDSAGLKLWKRRWFVLSNYCLFYYKGTQLVAPHSVCHPELHLYNSASVLFRPTTDSREESVLGSIPLPSYKILFCTPRECKNRKFTFKVSAFCYSLNLGDIRRKAQKINCKTINCTNIFSVRPKL